MRYWKLFVPVLAIFLSASAFGAGFSPTQLRLSAPNSVWYHFDGEELNIPVTVSGAQADVLFAVFTRGPMMMGVNRRSGYLGWHYVNRMDTCVYVSPLYVFDIGQHSVSWNGRRPDGREVAPCDYSFYFWGYSRSSPGVNATNSIQPNRFGRAQIVTCDTYGMPVSNPIIFDALPFPRVSDPATRTIRSKWVLGNDPADPTLRETTTYQTENELSRLVLNPHDYSTFFTQELHSHGTLVLTKREWVPHGESFVETDWAKNGKAEYQTLFTPEGMFPGGPVSNGESIVFPNIRPGEDGPGATVIAVDPLDGTVTQSIDLTRWWRDDSGAAGGPLDLEFAPISNYSGSSREYLFCSSPFSCLNMMIAPQFDEGTDPVRWVNGYGDFFADRNYAPDSQSPWACIDLEHPRPGHVLAADSNLFTLFPSDTGSTAAFGLFGPDGTGIGHFPLSGIDAVHALRIVDYGSAFDGVYYADGDNAGIWYLGYDSIQGQISNGGNYEHHLHVLSPYEKEVLRAGSIRQIIWEVSSWIMNDYSTVRIEFTADGGTSWTTVADSAKTASMGYSWIVPEVNSSNCRIRVTGRYDLSPSVPDLVRLSGTFTITGPSDVSEEEELPRAFAVANYPNPFNPSTTIAFTLPQAGPVSLAVYDVTGRKVAELARGFHAAGRHSVVWNAQGCASGVYFGVLKAGKVVETRKMLLVR